ncbi:PepSY domain-containing protein [Rhodococcus sp. 3Y1]
MASLNDQIRSASAVPPRLDGLGSTSVPCCRRNHPSPVHRSVTGRIGEARRLRRSGARTAGRRVGGLRKQGSLPLRTWISQLHRHLHLGEPGRLYSELAASWMWVVALGGVYLWFRRYRTARNARLLTIDRASTGRSRTLNWHGVVGIWIAVALVFLSATGLTWSTYAGENVSNLRTALSWTTPSVVKTLGDAPPPATGGHEVTTWPLPPPAR